MNEVQTTEVMTLDLTKPVVYTTKGNLNADTLVYATKWWVDPGNCIQFVETYSLDGEVVKESAHVLSLKGQDMSGQSAT